jgi:hypothetical protein
MDVVNHPAFPKPADQSAVLWRYMGWEKFEWLLSNGRLYMPRADQLGDPLEGSTPQGTLEFWRRNVATSENDEHRRIAEHNRAFVSRMAEGYRNGYFVSCWHMNPYENNAMWGCYAPNAESVAIATTFSSLRAALPRFVEIGEVRYIDYAVDELPTMNLFEHIMHKDIIYSFEREVRAVATSLLIDELGGKEFRADLFEKETDPGVKVYAPGVSVHPLVQSVILHPKASPDFAERVEVLCLQNKLPLPTRSRQNRKPAF